MGSWLCLIAHILHTMVPSTSAAAGRQIRLTLRCHREERGGERQAEDGQQQNGEKSAQ
jgi:hypothetical protein